MNLEQISIRNFQSLRSADLDLGAFTVIVGPSSSGKSALMRCFKAVASNLRGAGVVTRGQKQTAITVRTKTHTVTLERGEAIGLYRLADRNGTELTFTKLNGGVPERITQVLGIAPVPSGATSINFAGQFDRPYLLDETGASVARVLGELTNVSTIFEAVRTANKRRLAASSLLKTRQADQEQVRVRLQTFGDLAWRTQRLDGAENLHATAQTITEQIGHLGQLHTTIKQAGQTAARYANLAPVPDSDELDEANNRYLDLVAHLRGVAAKDLRALDAHREAEDSEQVTHGLEVQLREALRAAGICPTCGQPTV